MSVDVLKKTVVDKLPSDLEGLEGTIERLQDMIDTISRYVDNVIVSPKEKMISPHILSALSNLKS
jgi:translation initiation factor 3 subunit F